MPPVISLKKLDSTSAATFDARVSITKKFCDAVTLLACWPMLKMLDVAVTRGIPAYIALWWNLPGSAWQIVVEVLISHQVTYLP